MPTWEFGDGERVSGVQPLESLAKRTGCALEGGSASDAREVEEGAASRIEGVEGLDIEVKSDSGITIEGVSATPVVE